MIRRTRHIYRRVSVLFLRFRSFLEIQLPTRSWRTQHRAFFSAVCRDAPDTAPIRVTAYINATHVPGLCFKNVSDLELLEMAAHPSAENCRQSA